MCRWDRLSCVSKRQLLLLALNNSISEVMCFMMKYLLGYFKKETTITVSWVMLLLDVAWIFVTWFLLERNEILLSFVLFTYSVFYCWHSQVTLFVYNRSACMREEHSAKTHPSPMPICSAHEFRTSKCRPCALSNVRLCCARRADWTPCASFMTPGLYKGV